MASKKSQRYVSQKVKKILAEGVRRNTRKPYNPKANPRRKVSKRQAIRIALEMARKRGHRV